MTLGNMREHRVRAVEATCETCKHEAVINVDALPDELYVPDVALKLRCSSCGSRKIVVVRTGHGATILGYGRGRAPEGEA